MDDSAFLKYEGHHTLSSIRLIGKTLILILVQ